LQFPAVILISLLAVAIPAMAAAQSISQSISIAQLRQKLATSAPAAHDNSPVARLHDATLADQIDNLQLSERLTAPTLAEILATGTFGQQTQQSLELLADRSALLDPPAVELPQQPAPDANQQQQMLEEARRYVMRTLTHLPNFFATRTTARFSGIPPELNQSGMPVQSALHSKGSYSREITFRDGKELFDPMKHPYGGESGTVQTLGMESQGEFGSEAAVILTDVDANRITFHHWEHSPAGVVAVYRYSVPAEESHYDVDFSCNGSPSFHTQPAYHGTLAIDPATGAILRLTLQADSKTGDPLSHVASVIEYGPAVIGDQTYICPLRSLTFSVMEHNACTHIGPVQPLYLNRTKFTNYHRLGSTWRIVPDPPTAGPAPQK
jgi:hypothetical protein